jgi:hypothetical protein
MATRKRKTAHKARKKTPARSARTGRFVKR